MQEKAFDEAKIIAEKLEKVCREKENNIYAPLPLQRAIIPGKPYPFDALGTVAGAAARRIHEVVQSPDATCGQSILAALSLACQGFVDAEIDGRVYPISLFEITVSESGERKSATDKIALKSIHEWQFMLIKQHKEQQVGFKNKLDLWKKKREALLKKSIEVSNDGILLNFEKEPKPPCEGLILCDEPTLEGLEQLLDKGQPSVGIFSDEGGRLVGGHAMNADNALKTACGLSNLWDGKPLTRVRKSEGNKIYYGRRLAMHLMMQPVVLIELMKNQMLMGQGVLARCLFAAPTSVAGTRKYVEANLDEDPDVKTYHDLIRKIVDRNYRKQGKDDKERLTVFNPGDALDPVHMTLTMEAKQLWIRFQDETDVKMGIDQLYHPIKPFASKAAEQVLRIATIFAFSEQLEIFSAGAKIELDHITRAILLVEYYLHEILRILGNSACDFNTDLAIQTLEWIKRICRDRIFSITEVYQKGPTQIRTATKAKEIMRILQKHENVVFVPNTVIDGHKVREAWKLA